MDKGEVWSLVLAAGDGTRLSSLTTTAQGQRIPKQFCSLRGGASLMEEALARGAAVTAWTRVLTVVAEAHRHWWREAVRVLPGDNVIVQPQNKGTAAGLLLPLLHLARRDPLATVLVLPSDHFVHDEPALQKSMAHATQLAREDRQHVYLLGLGSTEPDPELGYIVPGPQRECQVARVARFVEKPTADNARSLITQGALLNMFIVAASLRALLRLCTAQSPDLVTLMADIVERDQRGTQQATAAHQLYPSLPTLDFSRHLLQGQESWLRVMQVPDCGWSDLGTPHRVAETLSRLGPVSRPSRSKETSSHFNLAEQHARLNGEIGAGLQS